MAKNSLFAALVALACAACVPDSSAPASSSKTQMPESPALKSLYIQSCYSCHGTGVNGAPRTGNEQDWAPRLATGMDTLLDHTRNGYNAMPPRGMCINCSDDDFRALINFMAHPSNLPNASK